MAVDILRGEQDERCAEIENGGFDVDVHALSLATLSALRTPFPAFKLVRVEMIFTWRILQRP